jgi:chromosome partitioning protein
MKTIAFFNNKGGVGKTSLVYHLAWMLHELGHRVLVVDLDPQSNLTSAFLEEQELEALWPDGQQHNSTVLGALQKLMDRLGDVQDIRPVAITDRLGLIPGDIGLGAFEDRLASAWNECLADNTSTAGDAFRVMTAFYRIMSKAARTLSSDVVLIDVGPNVGALNRAALVASDQVVIPIGADLFSLQGLRNLGPTLRDWRAGWGKRLRERVPPELERPAGTMSPLGYVLLNPSVRENRPVKSYLRWANRIPSLYRSAVLEVPDEPSLNVDDDPHRIAMIKHFKSLMPMAQDARKPMFLLKPADGAIGGHAAAVSDCYLQFKKLAIEIMTRAGICQD